MLWLTTQNKVFMLPLPIYIITELGAMSLDDLAVLQLSFCLMTQYSILSHYKLLSIEYWVIKDTESLYCSISTLCNVMWFHPSLFDVTFWCDKVRMVYRLSKANPKVTKIRLNEVQIDFHWLDGFIGFEALTIHWFKTVLIRHFSEQISKSLQTGFGWLRSTLVQRKMAACSPLKYTQFPWINRSMGLSWTIYSILFN